MDYKGQKLAARNTFIINPNGEIGESTATPSSSEQGVKIWRS